MYKDFEGNLLNEEENLSLLVEDYNEYTGISESEQEDLYEDD